MSSNDVEILPPIKKGFTAKQIKVMAVVGIVYLIITIAMPFILSNSPYPAKDNDASIYYTTFGEEPKYLDPAQSYSSDEYTYLKSIYETPYTYHYLKRPYKLIPCTAEAMPIMTSYDKDGNVLPKGADRALVKRMTFDITIKRGIKYQNHPCFVKNADGSLRWYLGQDGSFPEIELPSDLSEVATRELVAADYVYQIKRMGNPLVTPRPIYASLLARYFYKYEEFSNKLASEVAEIRKKRSEDAGAFYNREADELANPIWLDLRKYDCPSAEVIDKYTYRITLNSQYPQMIYWLAMPFFAPIPWEATRFYSQRAAVEQNIILTRCPVGTGPYKLSMSRPHWRMEMTRNANFKGRLFYPTEGAPGDLEAGLLKDAGRELPLIDKVVFVKEREAIPLWQKFKQGYYEMSGISSDLFDQAVNITETGSELTEDLTSKGISLITEVDATSFYYAFNFLDATVGGYDHKQRKLRQAVAIAFDVGEMMQIFMNGRGMVAHGPIPPGIAGHASGTKDNYDSVVFHLNEKEEVVRRSIEDAKKLMVEAGYPNGIGPDGKKLILHIDAYGNDNPPFNKWVVKQFAKLGIDLQFRKTDYNQFRKKTMDGNWQIIRWGWNADYPDPENFLFLLYGPNGKARSHGENAANYDNPDFNRLFEDMETMNDSPEREAIIKDMLKIYHNDVPWFGVLHTESYIMTHEWVKNLKPATFSTASLAYRRLDPKLRTEKRIKWNKPKTWPISVLLAVMIATILPAILKQIRKEEEGDTKC